MSDLEIPTERPDILVIGLGPAGSRAAKAAVEAGLSVLAIEKRAVAGTPMQCAEFVPSLLDMDVSGLDGVTSQRIERMETYVEDQQPDETLDFRGRMLNRSSFDQLLAQQAQDAGAFCSYSTVALTIGEDGSVTLKDGTVLKPKVIIGCDGPKSRAGAAIGSVNTEIVDARQITVPFKGPHDATDIFLRADIIGGYGWLFPKGDTCNLGLGVVEAERHSLKPLLADLHNDLMDQDRVGQDILFQTGGLIPVGGLIKSTGQLGDVPVILAGDAAGLANPISGAGIASAVQSGTMAGEAATALLRGDREALEDYEDEMAAVFGSALSRAVDRRKELMASYTNKGSPTAETLRRTWIAYPAYWAAA